MGNRKHWKNFSKKWKKAVLKFLCKGLWIEDGKDILQTNLQAGDIIDLVLTEYKDSSYGSIKYNKDKMYWIGYFYRYFSYTYKLSSNRVYKIDKPKELRDLFLSYHALSLEQAIKRVLESKGLKSDFEKDINRQFEIYER